MLKKFRSERNYTQQQMADIIGVSQSAYSKWERGIVKPTQSSKQALDAAIRRIKAYETGCLVYTTPYQEPQVPSFTWKRKLLKLTVAALIVAILAVLW